MKNHLLLLLFALMPCGVYAQLAVVSTQPASNAKNVPLSTTISVTFSEALDTLVLNQNRQQTWYTNLDSVISHGYSADMKTMSVNVVLKPNHAYFLAFTFVKAKSGAVLSTPFTTYFTTGSDFPPYSVSGTVSSGSTGVSPVNAIVGVSTSPVEQNGQPSFVGWSNVNNDGSYTIPNLTSGTYWPIAAKDVDNNGEIDPSGGIDVVAVGDSIIVANASLTNVVLTFVKMGDVTFHQAATIADSVSKSLSADKILKQVYAWDVDTTGKSETWEFDYTVNGNTLGQQVRVSSFSSSIQSTDLGSLYGLAAMRMLSNPSSAASSPVVIANTENAGGKQFRTKPNPFNWEFQISVSLGDLTNSQYSPLITDQSQYYWGVTYAFGYSVNDTMWQEMGQKYFVCNFSTGEVLQSTNGVVSAKDQPRTFSLSQNFPNPFNPSTRISYSIAARSQVVLAVFNTLGQKVAELVNEVKDAGSYDVTFNTRGLASGVYLYRIQAGSFVQTKKLVLMK